MSFRTQHCGTPLSLRVKSCPNGLVQARPVLPDQRTSIERFEWSALCASRRHTTAAFHLDAAGDQVRRHFRNQADVHFRVNVHRPSQGCQKISEPASVAASLIGGSNFGNQSVEGNQNPLYVSRCFVRRQQPRYWKPPVAPSMHRCFLHPF